MSRITFQDVSTSLGINAGYDIINAIRNSGSSQFQQYVPIANAENVVQVGQGILVTSAIQNEFITSLIERIGLVVVRKISLQNQLKKFKKGNMPQGRTIEEIFVDITQEHLYDPDDAENTVFKREIPNVHTLFHELNRKGYYKQTLQDSSLTTAFTSWGAFEGFVAGFINAIYNSAEVDEYKYMKLLVDNYYAKNLFTQVKVEKPDTQTTAKELVKQIRAMALKMTLTSGSRDFNAMAVHTRSDMEGLHLLVSADLVAQIDVEVLAQAFNMDKATFLGQMTIVDNFASDGLEAVLVDEQFFMVYDTLHKMETMRNSQGLYWNYYYHVWQVLSTSRFANAVAFVSGDVKPITQVIVDPQVGSMRQGKQMQYKAYVRATDGKNYIPVWSIEGMDGAVVSGGTTISENGLLSVADDQKGQLKIKATATYENDDDTTTNVVGEAVVTILPQI